MSGSDPVRAQDIVDATTGGRSVIVITGGSTGQVLTLQSDGTYAPATVSAGIGGSLGSTANRLLRTSGTGGGTAQGSAIGCDDSGNLTGVGTLSCGAITTSGALKLTDGTYTAHLIPFTSGGANAVLVRNSTNSGNGNFEASAALFATLRTTGVATFEGAINANANSLTVGAITSSALICAGAYTVATLPSASANAGKFAQVTDSSVTTFGSTVAGSGANRVPVFSNGTNWVVA